MNEIPTWWLVTTAIAAVIVMIAFLLLCAAVFMLLKAVKDIEPKIKELLGSVQGLVKKVEGLTEKVEGIADSAKHSVDSIGGKAQGVATNVEHFASNAFSKLQSFAPLLGTALAGYRLYSMYKQSHGKKPGKVRLVKSPTGMAVEVDPMVEKPDGSAGTMLARRGVEQSGSSSGS